MLVNDSSKEAMELARKGQKFLCGPNLEAFTVLFTLPKSEQNS
jgi:hypothetical protein